ncbi:hypothetical protein [Rhodococcus jostii]|uniref:Transcriptional regulator, AbiEi antitoxin, Type IV TA system n=1 Tax=Rhodococcus jostii TaxID=132919 RepID=A0A1H4XSD1_RHOJO|nr:hypothetical protein [Rhodococcus jostii]SED07644.1 Transcriptional regulator, AbiEi antitoxin, Type IV TA system [Rhodococcus jostii]
MRADDLIFRRHALADGLTDPELRRARTTGQLVTVAAGVYLGSEHAASLDAIGIHRARVAAAVAAHGTEVVVSHVSAAVLHGLDVGAANLDRVHLSRERRSGARRTATLHVHIAPLGRDDVVEIDGVAVTSLPRTVADVALAELLDQAVVIGDSALHRGGVSIDDVRAVVERHRRRKGIGAARRAVALCDGRSESPGESLSRIRMRECGMPTPELQYEVRTEPRTFVARVDFYWERWGVVGEFDGMGKYKFGSGQSGDIVAKEKLREDAIRDTGLEVIRWVWADLARFEVVKARFERACVRSRRR